MYQIRANEIVGKKIVELRSLQRVTQSGLSDRINDACGMVVSSDSIGRYERAERSMDLDTLTAIAIAMDVSLQAIIDGIDPRNGPMPDRKNHIRKLSAEEHEILRDIATDWDGDRKALIIADGVYSVLPPHRRREVIMELMVQMSKALESGEISAESLPKGLQYMQERLGGLYGL